MSKSEFVVESNGCCFFCSSPPPLPELKMGNSKSSGTYSIQYLSRYLRLDMRKVFHKNVNIPVQLLSKVQKSALKVELCAECAHWSAKASELCKQLEKIEMELGSFVQPLWEKLEASAGADKIDDLRDLAEFNSISMGKLKILRALREETKGKCSHKLSTKGPHIHIRNLSSKDVHSEILKAKCQPRRRSTNRPPTETGESSLFKQELPSSGDVIKTEPHFYHSAADPDEADTDFEEGCEFPESTAMDSDGSICPGTFSPGIKTEQNVPKLEYRPNCIRKFKDNCSINRKTGVRTCTSCSKEFSSYAGFYCHYKNIHLQIKHKCSLCGKTFSHISTCNRHQRTEHKGAKFTCHICNLAFELEGHLSNHQRTSKNCSVDSPPSFTMPSSDKKKTGREADNNHCETKQNYLGKALKCRVIDV